MIILIVLYVGVIMVSVNLMFGFVVIFVGMVCVLECWVSGGVLVLILIYFVWGLIMVFVLFLLFVV